MWSRWQGMHVRSLHVATPNHGRNRAKPPETTKRHQRFKVRNKTSIAFPEFSRENARFPATAQLTISKAFGLQRIRSIDPIKLMRHIRSIRCPDEQFQCSPMSNVVWPLLQPPCVTVREYKPTGLPKFCSQRLQDDAAIFKVQE